MAIFGGRRRAEELEVELARTRAMLEQVGALDDLQREERRRDAEQRLAGVLQEEAAARQRLRGAESALQAAQADLVETDAEHLLQEAGVYRFTHPLEDAVAYRSALAQIKERTRSAVTGRHAVTAARGWTVNGSTAQGAKMVKDFSTLLLRAYNAEADNCVRTVRPHNLASVRTRLDKTRTTIARLGKTMSIEIAADYHRLRTQEIELTADHLAKVEAERELVRARREVAREEETARREFEREKARLLKEQAHYRSAVEKLIAQGRTEDAADLEARLASIGEAIAGVEDRAANSRAGYVYVISNVGAFGHEIVKVGMTRRLEPMDRVRELGDASVPFRFDVHALVFSDDAVGLEGALHVALAEHRVNRVNLHREFFRATPAQVRDLLSRVAGNHLLEFTETAEALEWRASGAETALAPLPPEREIAPPPSEDGGGAEDGDGGRRAIGPLLADGEVLALRGVAKLRLLLAADDGTDLDLDPIALLLTSRGEVASDGDLVFFGQPDHDSGAVVLAADETGASNAVHVDFHRFGADVVEVLLTAQAAEEFRVPTRAHLLDLATGEVLGHFAVPAPGPRGMVQLGALQRSGSGWSWLAQPAPMQMDLEALVTAAGVSVE